MNENRNRVPRGVSRGGQFAASAKNESDASIHAGRDPGVDMAREGAYPNGRCSGCGHGLDSGHRCFQADCAEFDERSEYADEGHTTTGEPVEKVSLGALRPGDRVILDGAEGVVTSIDGDHKTTSIELDGDESTIASYANDTPVRRYIGRRHPMPDDLVYYTDPDREHSGWYKVDTFGLDEVVLRSRTGKIYPVSVQDLADAPGQVFGPGRADAARRAVFELEQARAAREQNAWSDTTLERLRAAERVRAQYSDYADDVFGGTQTDRP